MCRQWKVREIARNADGGTNRDRQESRWKLKPKTEKSDQKTLKKGVLPTSIPLQRHSSQRVRALEHWQRALSHQCVSAARASFRLLVHERVRRCMRVSISSEPQSYLTVCMCVCVCVCVKESSRDKANLPMAEQERGHEERKMQTESVCYTCDTRAVVASILGCPRKCTVLKLTP